MADRLHPLEYLDKKSKEAGLGLGEKPNFPVRKLFGDLPPHNTFTLIDFTYNELNYCYWRDHDGCIHQGIRHGHTFQDAEDILCNECSEISIVINPVYSFRATIVDGVVEKLKLQNMERETLTTHILTKSEEDGPSDTIFESNFYRPEDV